MKEGQDKRDLTINIASDKQLFQRIAESWINSLWPGDTTYHGKCRCVSDMAFIVLMHNNKLFSTYLVNIGSGYGLVPVGTKP